MRPLQIRLHLLLYPLFEKERRIISEDSARITYMSISFKSISHIFSFVDTQQNRGRVRAAKQITTGDSLCEIRQLLDCGREKGWGRIGFTGANSGCTEQENHPNFTANCSGTRPFLCQSLRAVHRAQKNRRL